jgi:hypothetical protein
MAPKVNAASEERVEDTNEDLGKTGQMTNKLAILRPI